MLLHRGKGGPWSHGDPEALEVEGILPDPGDAAETECWQVENYRFTSKSRSGQKSSLQLSAHGRVYT